MNPEHIIPLSLGGCNGFTVMVCKAKNSEVNQKIDAKMNNDFLLKIRQVQHDFRGHSGSTPVLKVKRAMVNNNPASWEYSKQEIKVRDHINKVDLQGEQTVELSASFDLIIRSKFVSKVALATGYFMFGDTFVQNADHNSLRTYVFADSMDNLKLDLRFFDEFQSPGTLDIPKSNAWEVNKLIASRKKSSGVIWGYAHNRIIAHVFVGSVLLGMVNFSAKVCAFHVDNDVHDDYGSVLRIVDNKKITCVPYRCELEEVLKHIDDLSKGE